MSKETDIRPISAALAFLPIRFRLPLKFGAEVLETITYDRVKLTVRDSSGQTAVCTEYSIRQQNFTDLRLGSSEIHESLSLKSKI